MVMIIIMVLVTVTITTTVSVLCDADCGIYMIHYCIYIDRLVPKHLTNQNNALHKCFECTAHDDTGLILGLHPANERRRYFVTTSLTGWV